MTETSKTLKYHRSKVEAIFGPQVTTILDVGAGPDPLVLDGKIVTAWDKDDGDGQYLATIPENTFDGLWSSHCLEHMVDVGVALENWIRVVKPGGVLIILVPHFIWYEKCRFPSLFNHDHKHTFSDIIPRSSHIGHRQNHFDFADIDFIVYQHGAVLESVQEQIDGFSFAGRDFALDQTLGDALAQIMYVIRKQDTNKAVAATTRASKEETAA